MILGVTIDAVDYSEAALKIVELGRRQESSYVCAANVHMVMEAYDSVEFARVVNGADLVTPDGMPLVWGLRLLGIDRATRVYGAALTRHTLAAAEREGISVGFYGGEPEVLEKLQIIIKEQYPKLQMVYTFSPPFRTLTSTEDEEIIAQINASSTRILFVGLGCPRQEEWMSHHKGKVQAVMVGIGAAFDFLSGNKPQAPRWMMEIGLEWFFRLCSEPRRLWRRYLLHNPRFMVLFSAQLLRQRFTGGTRHHG